MGVPARQDPATRSPSGGQLCLKTWFQHENAHTTAARSPGTGHRLSETRRCLQDRAHLLCRRGAQILQPAACQCRGDPGCQRPPALRSPARGQCQYPQHRGGPRHPLAQQRRWPLLYPDPAQGRDLPSHPLVQSDTPFQRRRRALHLSSPAGRTASLPPHLGWRVPLFSQPGADQPHQAGLQKGPP